MKKLSLSLLIFIITLILILIGITFSLIWYPNKEIYLALTSLGGSLAGGWLTLVGVKLTIQKSDEEKFVETYIEKIIALKESKDFLQDFRDEDCSENEGEQLWNIIVKKSSKFDSAYQKINFTIGGELAYKLYNHTYKFKQSYIIEYNEFLDSNNWVEIFGRDTIINEFIDSFIDSIDIVVNELIDVEEKMVLKYNNLQKKRLLI